MNLDLSVINYEKSMGEYIIDQVLAEKLRKFTLEKQMEAFKARVIEREDDEEDITDLPLDSSLFRGIRRSYRFAQIAPSNQGIIIDNGLIVGVKTDEGYLLLGQRYHEMLIPMFTDEYGGGQGDITCYQNDTYIILDDKSHLFS